MSEERTARDSRSGFGPAAALQGGTARLQSCDPWPWALAGSAAQLSSPVPCWSSSLCCRAGCRWEAQQVLQQLLPLVGRLGVRA